MVTVRLCAELCRVVWTAVSERKYVGEILVYRRMVNLWWNGVRGQRGYHFEALSMWVMAVRLAFWIQSWNSLIEMTRIFFIQDDNTEFYYGNFANGATNLEEHWQEIRHQYRMNCWM